METNRSINPAPTYNAGLMSLSMPVANVTTHPNSTRLVHPRAGSSTQVYFPSPDSGTTNAYTMHLGGWAERISFLGGDFAVWGTIEGESRTYFLQNYDYFTNVPGINDNQLELRNVEYADGTNIQVDWTLIDGLWVTDECSGIRLIDGRTFIAETPSEERDIRFSGDEANFTINLNALDASVDGEENRSVSAHSLLMNWESIAPDSEIRLQNNIFDFTLTEGRSFTVESTNVSYLTTIPEGQERQQLDVQLLDQDTNITLDWVNMTQFSLSDDILRFTYSDEPRGETTRNGANLLSFEALDDLIHIVYKDTDEGLAGEERLLLPQSSSYLEIITPAGLPEYRALALPNEPDYVPRANNNTGGECYPNNTVLPEANCSTNGEINPANGNLWLAITDLRAIGSSFDLDLMRSYNSRRSGVDGPFGFGWTTPYLLDYNVLYNAETSSRPITPETLQTFPVALDVTWAPRGIVTFITPTGSRHQFITQERERYEGGTLTAVTMPGWVISRESVRDPFWIMQQDNGLEFRFDAAGRLLGYQSLQTNRSITIQYPLDLLEGAATLGLETPIIIHDSALNEQPGRQLALYYNGSHRIVRAVLRDTTILANTEDCRPETGCREVLYTYNDAGQLIGATYNDGTEAIYAYDENNQLIEHNDPSAPIARHMTYGYDENNNANLAEIKSDTDESLPWRTLIVETMNEDERIVRINDELERSVVYTYTIGQMDSRQPLTTFTLSQQTSPLINTDRFEDIPHEYTWENGLLIRSNARAINSNTGRNGIDYQYTTSGLISCIACTRTGSPNLRIEYEPTADTPAVRHYPIQVTYADGAVETFAYDDLGRIQEHTNRWGGTYVYTRDEIGNIVTVVRLQDNATWEYRYDNDYGLVTGVTHYLAGTPSESTPYQAEFSYDFLGRLVNATDNVIGNYTFQYGLPEADSQQTTLVIEDPIGVQTRMTFNTTDTLAISEITGATQLLERTEFQYDAYQRLTQLDRILDVDSNERITTTYTYEPATEIEGADGTLTTINGYTQRIIEPTGIETVYTYDALNRIRRIIDNSFRTSDYTYSVENTGQNFGLRIDQTDREIASPASNTYTYIFDVRHQLREVTATTLLNDEEVRTRNWNIFAAGDNARQGAMNISIDGISVPLEEIEWGDYALGLPSGVNVDQITLPLASGLNLRDDHRPSIQPTFDFAGRLLRVVQGTQEIETTNIIYCADDFGGERVLYTQTDSALSCDSTSFQQRMSYDYHGRLTAVEENGNIYQFTYEALPESNIWIVYGEFTTPAEGITLTWTMHFDGLGQLIYWRDEIGTERRYIYDTLGRLVEVITEGYPEASYTFSYNEFDLLTEEIDGLGRGTRYSYNNLLQVTSQLNALTAAATNYSYTPTGQLNTIIDPDGNATIYRYDDPADPSRITEIIQPTGTQHRFEWDDFRNRIIYTDPFNATTVYTFDGTGLLWRVDDALEEVANVGNRPFPENDNDYGRRVTELHYSDFGTLVGFLSAVTNNETMREIELAYSTDESLTVSEADTGWSRTFQFDMYGRLLGLNAIDLTYDSLGRLTSIDTTDREWRLSREDQSRQTTLSDGFGGEYLFEYDSLRRLIVRSANESALNVDFIVEDADATPLLGVVQMEMTIPGLGSRTVIFADGDVRTGEQPYIEIIAHGSKLRYDYSFDNRLLSMAIETCAEADATDILDCDDKVQRTWRITYNAIGQPVRIEDPNGSFESFTYDSAGRLIVYQGVAGRNYIYAYDDMDRLVSISTETGSKMLIEYNRLDNVTGLCITRVEGTNDFDECIESSGLIERYDYDALGRLITREYVDLNGNPGTNNLTYNPLGLLSSYNGTQATYDDFGLLTNLSTGNQSYLLEYASLTRLASIGDRSVGYSASGMIDQIRMGTTTLDVQYDLNTLTLEDDANTTINYAFDNRGVLNALGVNSDTPQAFIGSPLLSAAEIASAEMTAVQFMNSTNDITEITYIPSDINATQLAVFTDLAPDGVALQQSFVTFEDGRIVVLGYDNDRRPLTTRVTDTNRFEVLYTQTFTYDAFGHLIEETRQYPDSTQVIIRLEYAPRETNPDRNTDVVTGRVVTIIRPLSNNMAQSGVGIVITSVLIVSLWITNSRKRRWIAYSLTSCLMLSVLSPLQAQRVEENFRYDYAYDTSGNLTQISQDGVTCTNFSYDSANRLVSTSIDGVNRTYTYDGHGQITQIGQTSLIQVDNQLLGMRQNSRTYFARLDGQPPFAILDSDNSLEWLLSDGQSRIRSVLGDMATLDQLWLYDGFGRLITLTSPGAEMESCSLDRPNVELPDFLQVQFLQEGYVYDSVAGLYFHDSRAYLPEINSYLQRDPHGPDVFGNVYTMLERNAPPRPVQKQPPIIDGIQLMNDSLQQTSINTQLRADAVRTRYMPQYTTMGYPLYDSLQRAREPQDRIMNNLVNLPHWLEHQYNLSAPDFSEEGFLQIADDLPGQRNQNGYRPMLTPQNHDWIHTLISGVRTPFWNALVETGSTSEHTGPRFYDISINRDNFYTIQQYSLLPEPIQGSATPLIFPNEVVTLLPRTLVSPEVAYDALMTTTMLSELPSTTPAEQLDVILDNALPDLPTLPPSSITAWRDHYFSHDIFGLQERLRFTIPDLPALDIPNAGQNTWWIMPQFIEEGH